MNEVDVQNQEAYLKLIDQFWEFDNESVGYVKERISESHKFPAEFQNLFDSISNENDQRIRWNIDVTDAAVMQHFQVNDEGYTIFKKSFGRAIKKAEEKYGCVIGYNEYSNNKAMFKNNLTKIKKILESIYTEYENTLLVEDLGCTKSELESKIIRIFERIGTVKKPSAKIQIVLSLNPVDWMLASTSSSISSCLNLENGNGGHRFFSGLPHLCGDNNRAMIYICTGEKKEYRGMKVDQPITRSWVLLDEKGYMSVIKWYANDYFNCETINRLTGTKLFKMHLSGKTKYPIDFVTLKSGIMPSIFNDDGGWYYDEEMGKIRMDAAKGKGAFQVFYRNGLEVTSFSNFQLNRPHFIDQNSSNILRLSEFEKYGLSFDKTVHRLRCPNCGTDKPVTLTNRNGSGKKVICLDCYKESLFTCCCCNQTYDKDNIGYNGKIMNGMHRIENGLMCSGCYNKHKKYVCECCGYVIFNNVKQTSDGTYICMDCYASNNLGYKTCSVCGKVSKKSIKSFYHPLDKTLKDYCAEHMPSLQEEIDEIVNHNLIDSNIEAIHPYMECPTCHSITSEDGRPCLYCRETNGFELNV